MPSAVSANPLEKETKHKSKVTKRKTRKKVSKKQLLSAAKARVAKRRAVKTDTAERPTPEQAPKNARKVKSTKVVAKKGTRRTKKITTDVTVKARATKRVTKVDVPRPPDGKCRCGCGGATARFFCLGHDTRFHGRLKRIRRGEGSPEKLLGKRIAKRYNWKKVRGGGFVPDVDYAGRKFRRNKSNS